MSDNSLDYRRGYTEMVRLCAMMLVVLTETNNTGDNAQPALSEERAESLRDECARLLNLFQAQEELSVEKHDAMFHRMMDMFTEIVGNDSNAWLSWQPAMQLQRKYVN